MDNTAINYNPKANTSDDSCEYEANEATNEIINTNEESIKEEISENENNNYLDIFDGLAIIACGGAGIAIYKRKKNNNKLQKK